MTDAATTSRIDALVARLEEFLGTLRTVVDNDALDRIADVGLHFSEARVLLLVGESPKPLPIGQIAERLDLSVAAAGRNVDHLVRKGLVRRVECAEDRRVRLVSATAEGLGHVTGKRDIWRGAMRTVAERLPADVAADLESALGAALSHHPTYHRKDTE
ncbi:MAG: MarR family transcriptional regulator [Thermoleophilia bacterium]|nr:MarR family transcriptional regulator [Thermoleophilia bacterium]